MTLEEAKKEIAIRKAMNDSVVDTIKEPWNPARTFYKGVSSGLGEAIALLEGPDTEPVGNPDKLTLTELAHELRKLFKFKYLAYGEIFAWGGCYLVLTIGELPLELRVRDVGGEGVPCYIHEWTSDGVTNGFLPEDLAVSIDLSEYADENGEIDYSRCIVEVSDDAE